MDVSAATMKTYCRYIQDIENWVMKQATVDQMLADKLFLKKYERQKKLGTKARNWATQTVKWKIHVQATIKKSKKKWYT